MTWQPGTTVTTPCRKWRNVNDQGYARKWNSSTRQYVRAHRWVVEQVEGRKLKPSEVVLHLCDEPSCVRYDHLHVGTRSDNQRDSAAKGHAVGWSRKTHCIHGHEFTPENTYHKPTPSGGVGRACLTCKRSRGQR